MGELAGLILWGVMAGLVAGILIHINLSGESRSRAVRWCLIIGSISVGVICVELATNTRILSIKSELAIAFVGLPALVSGIVVSAIGKLK